MNRFHSKDLLVLAFLGCVCALFFRNVFLKPGELLVSPYSDVVGQFGYWEGFLRQSLLQEGRIPQYNSYSLCGHPVTGNIQYLEYYPFRIASYLFSPDWASGFNFFLHAWLLCAGGYLLARQVGLPIGASVLSAIVGGLNLRYLAFVYAGFSLLLPSVSAIPWVWLGFWRMLSGKWGQGALLSGTSLALCFLGGWSQIVLLNGLCLGLLIVCSFFLRRKWTHATTLFLYAMVVAGVAMGLSAFKLVPSIELSALTTRSDGLSLALSCKYSLPFRHLIGLLVPGFHGSPAMGTYRGSPNFWEMGCSFTAAGLLLGIVGCVHAPSRERFLLVVLLGFCLLFSLGEASPLFLLCWRIVPGLSYFRGPARVLFFFGQALALLAGFGATWLVRDSPWRGRCLWASLLLFLLLVPLLLLGLKWVGSPLESGGPTIETTSHRLLHLGEALRDSGKACLRACLWIGGTIGLFLLTGKLRDRSVLFWTIAAGLTLGESLILSVPLLRTLPENVVYPKSPVGAYLKDQEGWYRVLDLTKGMDALPDGLSWRYRLQKVGGYDPSALKLCVRAVSLLKGRPVPADPTWMLKAYRVRNRTALNLLNVRYLVSSEVLSSEGMSLREQFREVPTFAQFVGSGLLPKVYVYENEDSLPRAWWVKKKEILPEEEAWSLLENEGFSPLNRVLLHKEGVQAGLPGFEGESLIEGGTDEGPGRVSVTRQEAGRLDLSVRGNAPGWVVVSEMGVPGWRAFLDGRETRVLRANGWMLAVFCPPGKHELFLEYEAPGFRMGMGWSAATVLLLLVVAAVRRKGRLRWRAKNTGA